MRIIFIISVAFLLESCATSLTYKAQRLKTIEDDREVASCKFLGLVRGSSNLTGAFKDSGMNNAYNEALNDAAERGATHVVIPNDRTTNYWKTSQEVNGKAFDCASTTQVK